MPCTVYILFHILDIKENKRDLLTLPQDHCRDNDTLTNITPSLSPHDIPRNRSKRLLGALGAIASAALPAVGKLATLAVEELGAYLQRKRNKALNSSLAGNG